MEIFLHDDALNIVKEEAAKLDITFEEALNFLIRFAAMHKPITAEKDILILNRAGQRFYERREYDAWLKMKDSCHVGHSDLASSR